MRKNLFLLCLPFALAANPVFNGSFELGTDGFALEQELRTDLNKELKFHPLKTASAAPGEGKQSLELENPYAEYYNLFSKDFRLKPSTQYEFSVKMKSSVPGDQVYFGVFKVDPKWSAHAQTFSASKEWKTYTFRFTTAPKEGWYHILIRPGNKDVVRKSSIFFDELKIEEVGKPGAVQLDAIAVPDKNLYLRGEEAALSLKITNPDAKPYSAPVTVTGKDEYTGKVCFTETVPVSLNPGETKNLPLKREKLNRYAGIRVSVSGPRLKTHDSFFSVIGKYTAKPFNILQDFVVAFNGGMEYQMAPQSKVPAYRVFNSSLEKRIETFSKIGCRILRDHDGGVRGVNWPAVEWKRGKFDFSHLDRQMALYDKYNIVLFPVIGDGFIENYQPWQDQRWPLWAVPLSERVKNDPPNCIKSARGHILLPPKDLYRNYIFQTVKHLKGRVPVYEIMNEPNLYLAPETYVDYLKVAHDAIRKADPAAKISAFCVTSDFGAAATPWMQAAVKAGGLNYTDNIGFHPYGGRELGSIRPADRYIADLRKKMRSYGKGDMPLWNTELYYLIDQQVEHNSHKETLCQPHHIVWRFLVDLGEGVVQSISIHANYLWKRMLTPNMQTGRNYHELIPSENAVAYNAMARLFERAKPVKKIRYSNGNICYVYRRDGKLQAAIWNYQKKKGISADFSGFSSMTDLFGNAEKPGVKPLRNAPYYLFQGTLSENEFLRKLENLPIQLEQPVSCGEIARLAGSTLLVMLHNDSEQEQSGVAGITGGGLSARKMMKFSIAPRRSLSLEIPVKEVKSNGKQTELMLQLKGSVFRLPQTVVRNKTIGKTFEMERAKGEIRIEKNSIVLSMTVRDTSDSGPAGTRNPWETDCVELFFDTAPQNIPARHAQAYTDKTFRLFITPRDKQKLHALGAVKPEMCKLQTSLNKDGYSFTLTIPVSVGKILGFDVKIDDSNGKTIQEFTLGSGEKLFQNRCNFSLFLQK